MTSEPMAVLRAGDLLARSTPSSPAPAGLGCVSAGAVALALLMVMTSCAAGASPAAEYISAARPNGVVGGAAARALSKAVIDALHARSDVAQPDGALALAAAWFVAANGESRKRRRKKDRNRRRDLRSRRRGVDHLQMNSIAMSEIRGE